MTNINKSGLRDNMFKHIIIPLEFFTLKTFNDKLMLNLQIDNTYSILVKFGFLGNSLFYMSGSQIGIKISSFHNLKYYSQIFKIIESRIEDIIGKYNIESLPDSIIILYKPITISNVKLLNTNSINSLPLNRNQIEISKLKKNFNSKYLPLTINNNKFGYLIESDLKNNYIKTLITNIESSGQQIPELLKNKNLISNSNIFINKDKKDNVHIIIDRKINSDLLLSALSSNYSNISSAFYSSSLLTKNKNLNISNSIQNLNVSNINVINKTEVIGYFRTVFDLATGLNICEAIDLKLDDVSFIRTIDNYSLLIKNNQVKKLNRKINFDYLKAPYTKTTEVKHMSNPNFGVLDIETYVGLDTDNKEISKVYNIGYTTLQDKSKINTFYLSDLFPSLDSNLLIINCINSMLIPKYHNYI